MPSMIINDKGYSKSNLDKYVSIYKNTGNDKRYKEALKVVLDAYDSEEPVKVSNEFLDDLKKNQVTSIKF